MTDTDAGHHRRPAGRAAFLGVLAVGLLLTACGASPGAGGGDLAIRNVQVLMTTDDRFEPDRVQVRRGETVRFVIRNATGAPHDVYLGTPAEQRLHLGRHDAVAEASPGTTHMGYPAHVAPFGTVEMMATFSTTAAMEIGCHVGGHYASGMRLTIEVAA